MSENDFRGRRGLGAAQAGADGAMSGRPSDGPGTEGLFVELDDGVMHVVVDGVSDGVAEGGPGAPALLLIHGSGASTASWDPVVPALAAAFRVVRVDLLGHGKSSGAAGGYGIPAHARRVGAALDRIGVGRVTVVGHSMGCMAATALAEQRPEMVAAAVLIDMAPSLDAANPEGLLVRLLLSRFPGGLLWRLRSEAAMRKAMRSAFAGPVDIPDAVVGAALGMTHRALAGTSRAAEDYLRQRSLPDRLAALGLPLLAVFGAEDARYPASSAEAYRAVPGARVELLPGVGHTPMLEDPGRTSTVLLEFTANPTNS